VEFEERRVARECCLILSEVIRKLKIAVDPTLAK
jgi:hypothetical protein